VVLAAAAASAQLLLSGRLLAEAAGVLLLSGCLAISAVLIRNAIPRARGEVSPV